MRARLHSKLIAALLAQALVASGAAQGMLLMRCGPTVRMSCCCPKAETPPSSPTMAAAAPQCCDTLAIPTAPAQATHELAVTTATAPLLVAALDAPASFEPLLERLRHVPRLDPPPGLSPVLAHCALLI